MSDEWTTAQVADAFDMNASSVGKWAKRHGITPVGFVQAKSGQWTALYAVEQVRTARAAQPGRGHRARKDTSS